jgi:fluoroquinolone transport system permease protein
MNSVIIKYDFVQIRKDPLLILSSIVPVLIWALVEFGFPFLQEIILNYLNYNIEIHYYKTVVFFVPLIPMMLGMVFGFMLLDERDEGIITTISVTPFGKTGYFKLRMGLPFVFSFLVISIFSLMLNLSDIISFWQIILFAFITSLNAPIMLLFLAAFADNKVEGMAISKGFGLLLSAILIDYLVVSPYDWLAAYSPIFWIERAIFSSNLTGFSIYIFIGLITHILLLAWLFKKFQRKIE